ncbi:MAG: TonB-dependent receptor [Alphaproteobacteria bacterium]|nr:TonB-dependent receptor [Alphaproteobacteria bacterium]
MNKISLLCATTALVLPSMALAQSTGTTEMETKDTIVVTGTRQQAVDGVQVPDTSKTRQVLTSEFIQRQVPGQSVDEIINMMPGVSFQNNDPFGASGGTLSIRGFDATRISQTIDGIPVNDTGNYSIYSGQQLDPELIERIDVSLGSTDVDSPTASATGSTVNYRSRIPTDDFHVRLQGSVGSYAFMRLFGVLDTGIFTPFGTKAWISGSQTSYENPYNRNSKLLKDQFNAKVYQPIGSGRDFISAAFQYNRGRNNNFSSGVLRTDPTVLTVSGTSPKQVLNSVPRLVGTGSTNRFPLTRGERAYDQGSCQTDTPQAGVADAPNTCGTAFDYSYNPNDIRNIRVNSRFTLADGLVLTVDPSYQYTRANGGASAVIGNEKGFTKAASGGNPAITTPIFGFIGGRPYFGTDLNGDGDLLDTVEVYSPSQTETKRFIVISSLRWDVTDTQTLRLSYTYDHGHHRQTGESGFLGQNGYALSLFPVDNPIVGINGIVPQKRDRLSYAILNKISGDYRGEFFDSRLTINAGIAAPFFKRDLNNHCVTENTGNGFIDCIPDAASQAAFLAANPTYQPPQHRVIKYNRILPNGGFTYDLVSNLSVYANYAKGLQVASTDNLYNSFSFPVTSDAAKPKPETTDNIDGGLRYRSSKVQAQLAAWYTFYKNRLASAYDPELDQTVYRNLGTVHKHGFDGSIAYQPIEQLSVYAFGSYLKSKIIDDVINGECTAAQATAHTSGCQLAGDPIFAATAGRRESGSPTYTFGGRIEGKLGPVELGVQAKRTGPRFINDVNLPVVQSYTLNGVVTTYQVYGAKTPAYTLVDLDARVGLGWLGVKDDRTYVQFNVTNVFDKLYVGGFSGNLSNATVRNAFIGSPRAYSATLVVGF